MKPVTRSRLNRVAAFALLSVCAGAAAADAPEPLVMNLRASKAFSNGKAAYYEATAGAQPVQFSLPDLTIAQPVTIVVSTVTANEEVAVRIDKSGRSRPEFSGKAAAGKAATARFRTQGDLVINVAATGGQPAKFHIFAWVGEPTPPPAAKVTRPLKGDAK